MSEIIPDYSQITREIYTVSKLNQMAKSLLENALPLVWLSGELSNLSQPSSGHMYFTLKDELAQVRCAMFRFRNSLLNFMPKNGLQVLVRAKVSLYEGRGDYQLLIEHMEEAGDGALRQAFEMLKQKLAAQGLFEAEHKKLLPRLPRCIGVVTSPTGAAIRDVLSVLKRRMPRIPIVIYPTAVQGAEAGSQIAKMIAIANQRGECDVLIVGRGGGSLEDLWPFNEENVARAIFASQIPIVSAVGHEIDFTIADFVADVRAATPSAAAELVSPEQQVLAQQVLLHEQSLTRSLAQLLEQQQKQLAWLGKRLVHPKQRLETRAQQLDYLEQRLSKSQQQFLQTQQLKLNKLSVQLQLHNPQTQLKPLQTKHCHLAERLRAGMEKLCEQRGARLATQSARLQALSPLATLSRGYAIVYKGEAIVRSSTQLAVADELKLQLEQGKVVCRVEKMT